MRTQIEITEHEDFIFKSNRVEVKIESPYTTELKHKKKLSVGWKKRVRTLGENSSKAIMHSPRQKRRTGDADEEAQHATPKKVRLGEKGNSQNSHPFISAVAEIQPRRLQ